MAFQFWKGVYSFVHLTSCLDFLANEVTVCHPYCENSKLKAVWKLKWILCPHHNSVVSCLWYHYKLFLTGYCDWWPNLIHLLLQCAKTLSILESHITAHTLKRQLTHAVTALCYDLGGWGWGWTQLPDSPLSGCPNKSPRTPADGECCCPCADKN